MKKVGKIVAICVMMACLAAFIGVIAWAVSRVQLRPGPEDVKGDDWAQFHDEWIDCMPILTEEEQARCDEAERVGYPKIAY